MCAATCRTAASSTRNVAKKSQPVASHIIEPVFADGWIRDPIRIGRPGKVRGRLPHPRQARGSRAQAQGAVIRAQPVERKDAGLAVIPDQSDVAWRQKLSGAQPWFEREIDQAYQALTGKSIAMGRDVVSQPQRAIDTVGGILPSDGHLSRRAIYLGDINVCCFGGHCPSTGRSKPIARARRCCCQRASPPTTLVSAATPASTRNILCHPYVTAK